MVKDLYEYAEDGVVLTFSFARDSNNLKNKTVFLRLLDQAKQEIECEVEKAQLED